MEQNEELNLAWSFIENTGTHLFLTGRAGTGKTTFLRRLKEAGSKRMVVLAPTGIAAINAGGMTIHSFFQLPFAPYVPETSFSAGGAKYNFRFGKEKIRLIRSIDLLVIDEISMVRADLMDAMDNVLRRHRDRNRPFGGVQLLMIGDLQQLAPVIKDEEWQLLQEHYETPYFFSSRALKASEYCTIELKTVYRQKDGEFLDLLNRVRDFVSEQQRLRKDCEAFHQAVESLSRTGLMGVAPGGEVRCVNSVVREMFGVNTVGNVADLDRIMPGMASRLEALEDGSSVELPVGSELRLFNVSVECRTVMDGQTPVRVYVFEEKADEAAEARSQENAQWQKMTRIISHEVLNTITPIVSLSDTLLGMTEDRNVREGIEVIGESARGLLGFVNGYRSLSRVPVPKIHPFKFKPMLDYVLQPLMPDIETIGGRVDISLDDDGMVLFADEQLMRQVFANILKNAVNALRDRFGDSHPGVPVIIIRAFVNASDNTEIHISNNGWPIPDADAEHIFDPFFTTRAEGTGVGLALSRQIMRAHSGTIRLDRSVPGLTTFVLTL